VQPGWRDGDNGIKSYSWSRGQMRGQLLRDHHGQVIYTSMPSRQTVRSGTGVKTRNRIELIDDVAGLKKKHR